MDTTRGHRPGAPLIAFGSAALFGFGPVSVGYFARIVHLSSFSASVRLTALYFLAVYLVVAGLGAVLRLRSPRAQGPTLVTLWRELPARARLLLAVGAASNAVSGWCFFDMLGRIDPLSAAVIMALTIVFNLFAARLMLGEEIRLTSAAGRRKWLSFALIIAGVILASLHAYSSGDAAARAPVTMVTLLVGFASSLFAAMRTVGVKGAMNGYSGPRSSLNLGLPLAVTRFVYLFAFAFTLAVSPAFAVLQPREGIQFRELLLPNPFIGVLGLVYGGAYALNYIAMSRIEASRMALITRSAIAFTALYMVVATVVFHSGRLPSIVQVPAAALVIGGAYLATRPDTRPLPIRVGADSHG